MSKISAFPYPSLLSHLPNSMVTPVHGYYNIRPHKTIRLMVKEKPGKDEMGIYVFSTKKNIDELVAILKCCKVVHNFDSEAEPWLYMEEDSGFFYSDIDKLAAWIKSIK